MNRREWFLYASRFLSGFAGWLIFLAVALMVKERYGANQVPMTFLLQSLPPLIFSNWLARLTNEKYMKTVFVSAQLLGVPALLLLNERLGLPGIYTYILLNSMIQTLCNPILVSMAVKAVPSNRWEGVHLRLTSIQSSTLAIAPIFGGWLAMTFGFDQLILLTAICAISGAALMLPAIPRLESSPRSTEQIHWFQQWRPLKLPNREMKLAFRHWGIFLVLGALLNTVEFPIFEQAGLSRGDIGAMLGFWGIGNLVAFAYSLKKATPFSARIAGLAFTTALAIFVMQGSLWLALSSFLVGGFFNSYLAGILRNRISQSIPEGTRSLDVWAAINQQMGFVNLIIYGSGGYLLGLISPTILGGMMIAVGLALSILVHEKKVPASPQLIEGERRTMGWRGSGR